MGNAAPHRLPDAAGRVILSDGGVLTYDEPLTAAELMLEHPQHVVVEFQPIASGRKPAPLPADQKLEIRKTYLMLRVRKGKPIQLSSEEARRLILANAALKSNALLSYTGFLPLFARICPAVGGRSCAAPEKRKCRGDSNEREKAAAAEDARFDCFAEILEGRPEFLSRQMSGKGWKPSLDPIREKAVKAKVRHWIIL
ncbi:uncharacterized protein LOC131000349 [Salvia miltiorrhiza]|uniref:uncharacterized protein LOC131000349 n=1 Tax=Salvia miltiorrhiza TaxID=226208 RepID=UPI0025ACDC70|nr:uncharacterized protein LOC131000349 [Salvia miltiorrhiza]